MPHTDDNPNGREIRLRHGDQSAAVVELGAALRSYAVGGRPLVDGFAADAPITGGRGQLLVPWPNRIGDGRYHWHGQDLQLSLTEPVHGNAIHGLVQWHSWQVLEQDESRVVLALPLRPQPGYPFHLDVRVEYRLAADGLTVTATARNRSAVPAPYGAGQHPYLTIGTDLVDDAVLTVPGRRRLRTDEEGLPVGVEDVEGTPYDFRAARPIGGLHLDTAFTELERDADGRAVVRLAHPSGEYGTDLWLGEGTRVVQLYTGDTLAEGERRRSIAVEPMSCPPDAFRSGTDLVELAPGEQHVLRWGISPWHA
ncbi:aldose 1-epimerase family protein [Streptomyces sp. NPDC092296]|uniref:aldose 1-epimerase family protein n=1 Tax=Streptomyces sp. NPDC092296 TaxID=3366012 RepID=UPI00382491D8